MREILQKFYSENANTINTGSIILYFVLIYIAYVYKVRGYVYSAIILFAIFLVIIIGWYAGIHKLDSLRRTSCIIGTPGRKRAMMNGLMYDGCLDYWHITHVLMWLLIGILTPNKYLTVIILSILWEFIEHKQFSGDGSCPTAICFRLEDLGLNMIGYVIGSLLSS